MWRGVEDFHLNQWLERWNNSRTKGSMNHRYIEFLSHQAGGNKDA